MFGACRFYKEQNFVGFYVRGFAKARNREDSMKKLEKYLNNGREDLRLWQKNWFFAATLFVVVLNIVLFAALGGKWHIDTDNLYSASDNAQGFVITGNTRILI